MAKDHSPTDGWRAVRVPKTMRTRVPLEDFPALLDAAEHPRDRAVIAVGLFTFLRGSEMRTLRIDDLDLGEHRLAIYRHKTKQPDVLPVSSELHAEMLRWLNWYRADQGGVLRPGWHLLPAKFPNYTFQDPVTRRIAVDHTRLARLRPTDQLLRPYEVVKRALARLDYPTYWEGEHTLRRSGARALADTLRQQGYDGALMRVASMLGHANTRVTEQYIGWDVERERRNADIAGKPMFPTLGQEGIVIELREAQ
jgi:integrase